MPIVWKCDENVRNDERWDYQDNSFWKLVGQTGLRPKKNQVCLEPDFHRRTIPWLAVVGTAYDAALGDLPADIKQKDTMDMLSSNSIHAPGSWPNQSLRPPCR